MLRADCTIIRTRSAGGRAASAVPLLHQLLCSYVRPHHPSELLLFPAARAEACHAANVPPLALAEIDRLRTREETAEHLRLAGGADADEARFPREERLLDLAEGLDLEAGRAQVRDEIVAAHAGAAAAGLVRRLRGRSAPAVSRMKMDRNRSFNVCGAE